MNKGLKGQRTWMDKIKKKKADSKWGDCTASTKAIDTLTDDGDYPVCSGLINIIVSFLL